MRVYVIGGESFACVHNKRRQKLHRQAEIQMSCDAAACVFKTKTRCNHVEYPRRQPFPFRAPSDRIKMINTYFIYYGVASSDSGRHEEAAVSVLSGDDRRDPLESSLKTMKPLFHFVLFTRVTSASRALCACLTNRRVLRIVFQQWKSP